MDYVYQRVRTICDLVFETYLRDCRIVKQKRENRVTSVEQVHSYALRFRERDIRLDQDQ